MSLAKNTQKAYSAGEIQYLNFCRGFQVNPVIPATENVLSHFAVFLARTVKHTTIKSYLFGVRHFHLKNNVHLELSNFHRLQYLLRGIKRSQGNVLARPRLPITVTHLRLFKEFLQPETTKNYNGIMLWAAICTAFFGFLRISEFTYENGQSQQLHSTTLNDNDIIFYPSLATATSVIINIKTSKTDPFRKGMQLILGATDAEICPVKALQIYFKIKNSPINSPLFSYQNGKPLSRKCFTEDVRNLLSIGGLDPTHYAGHSFRIGAATTAGAAKLPAWLIKTLGRWSSDCFETYIRTPRETLIQASQRLARQI